MNVLSVIHGPGDRAELFNPLVAHAGHALDEWSFAWGTPPPRPLDAYDAVFVGGGSMHADQDAWHPWLREETVWLQELIARRTPVLGVCLGVQLLARAGGSWVTPLPEREFGWHEVELTEEGAADPVLGALPRRFPALEWHHYTYGVPGGGVELARTDACTQAFRLGEACWGVQFHPEVTAGQLDAWLADADEPPPDMERVRAETADRIGSWNELGRTLCRAFLAAAEQSVRRVA